MSLPGNECLMPFRAESGRNRATCGVTYELNLYRIMEIDPRQNFIEFALHVIDHLGLPHPDVPTDGGGALEFGLNIDGLATMITYEPEIQPGHVLLECRVGRYTRRGWMRRRTCSRPMHAW